MIECSEHVVHIPFLAPSLAGLRVVQLTDLHRSPLTPDALLREAVARCLACKPDLILLTGDFVSEDPADIAPCMELLAPLTARSSAPPMGAAAASADASRAVVPLGVYAVAGNHDVKTGLSQLQRGLEDIGVVLLCNSNVQWNGELALVGLDEDYFGTPDVVRAFDGIADNTPTLVMAHNPGESDLLADRSCIVFSGHTHGGQLYVPLLTKYILQRIKAGRYRAGWYTTGKARLYVNRGVGNTSFPFRFRCPPEIALFILQPEIRGDELTTKNTE